MSWLRNVMYDRLIPYVKEFRNGKLITFGGSSGLLKYVSRDVDVLVTHHEDIDAQKTEFNDGEWDYIITDQVMEHVDNPWYVVNEHKRILRSGGVAICTSVFYRSIHTNHDHFRFTPDGLCKLFSEFEILESGSWGNKDAAFLAIVDKISIEKTEIDRLNLHNDRKFPIVVWVVAKKN